MSQAPVQADSTFTVGALSDSMVIVVLPGATTGTGLATGAQVTLDTLKDYFAGGVADVFESTTAIATPSAFTVTTFAGFASTISGAVLMGFGTTHDVALKNRAGTTIIGITSNTTGVTMAGALAITGALSGVTTLAASSTVTITQGTANTAVAATSGYSLTGSSAVGAETWTGTLNTSGTPTVLSYALTVTATNAASLYFNYLGGAGGVTSLFKMTTAGAVTAGGTVTVVGAFGCNGASAQTAYVSGGAVVTTGAGLASYGYTEAQANAIVTLLNNCRAALVANGIMS